MRIPSRRRLKKRLSRELIYYPLLRMLLFKPAFRVAFFSFLALLTFFALFLPKIWRVTPKDFNPVVKISGLDLLQAWSLRRTARRAAAAGNHAEANYAWQAAISNLPADPDLFRGFIRNVIAQTDPDPATARSAFRGSLWLMRLTGTNQADLELSTQLYEKFRQHDLTLHFLSPRAGTLTREQQAVYLKALFHHGPVKSFLARWRATVPLESPDPEMGLYEAAYQAGWGPAGAAVEGRKQLEKAAADPIQGVLANRILLTLDHHLSDAARYKESLDRLTEARADSLLDHVNYWKMLDALGRQPEAMDLARNHQRPPVSSGEAARYTEALVTLGLKTEARDFLRQHAATFGDVPDIWVLYGNIAVDGKEWNEVRGIALEIRQRLGLRDSLAGFSQYLEGRAELGLARTNMARLAFDRAAGCEFESAQLALAVGSNLSKIGHAKPAREILLRVKPRFSGNAEYWQALFGAALELKDSALVLEATSEAYRLVPNDPKTINRYAAALLLNRQRPEEAVKLTLQLVSLYPTSIAAIINHSLALLLNHRTEEARGVLNGIDSTRLLPAEKASYYLAWFEVYYNLGRFDHVTRVGGQIDRKYLFPIQVEWMEGILKTMGEKPAPQAIFPPAAR